MEMIFKNYEHKDNKLSFEIEKGQIIGITGKNINEIVDLIALKSLNKGQLIINDQKVNKENIWSYRRKIALIRDSILSSQSNVLNIMIEYIKRHKLEIKDPLRKITDSLKIVSLEESILKRNIQTLSSSEKKLLQIALSLLSNPDLIIFEEPFKCLDKYNEKKLIMLIQRLKEQFQKTIIIASDDSNILYKYTNKMLFIKNDQISLEGKTNEVFLDVEYLKKNKFNIPEIVEFTYLAKNKKEVKIDYHKDVRDIIKDIYKHI
ncbi:MAG: ATP-binding cassette domain-containing protein [Bacilli bacterium]|nr:ATP-binding cassette domain-containing protein [Bacilli bacterium]